MKNWDEMTEAERQAMLSPTVERTLPDGTAQRVPKDKSPEGWMSYLSPYMHHKYLEAMSWSHEAAALAYAVSSCGEIIDDALFAHYKSALSEAELALLIAKAAEVSFSARHLQNLQDHRAMRRRGGQRRHLATTAVKVTAMQEWSAKPEEERSRRGAKKEFAGWVQDTFGDENDDPIPKDEKTVYGWISKWEKEALHGPK